MVFHGNFTFMKYDKDEEVKMVQRLLFIAVVSGLLLLLSGCNKASFDAVPDKDVMATVNIQEPSLTFFDIEGNNVATWPLKKSYTGATLWQDNTVVLYGFGLAKANVYGLDGEHLYDLKTGTGVTNIYVKNHKAYVANGETNQVQVYDANGELIAEHKVGNYPMSMYEHEGNLYVINYKDTTLSVLDAEHLQIEQEWSIDKSANGLIVPEKTNELWIGGHGEGAKPNRYVKKYDLKTGELIGTIEMPLMPIEFAQDQKLIYTVSHGTNDIYAVNHKGEVSWRMHVGANPFAIAIFKDYVIVAGYDDHTLYMIQNGEIIREIPVDKGPFKLLVREGSM